MDLHLDRKIRLSEESEYKSLYTWFLFEIGDGARNGYAQIPWEWSLYFTVSDIRLISTLSIGERFDTRKNGDPPEINEREFIRAKLTPNNARDYASTSYSMFGTSRVIQEFELCVYQRDDDKPDDCSAWGSPSYTTDFDFRDETIEDTLQFYVHLRPERFARFAKKIAEKSLSEATLRATNVNGFYAPWSPAITTHYIKVLTSERAQAVEVPEGSKIEPPRLGRIGELELYFSSELTLRVAAPEEDQDEQYSDPDDDYEGGEALSGSRPVVGATAEQTVVPLADPAMLKLLRSLRTAAWIIALLLFVSLIRALA
jgi:hypothetical protein